MHLSANLNYIKKASVTVINFVWLLHAALALTKDTRRTLQIAEGDCIAFSDINSGSRRR